MSAPAYIDVEKLLDYKPRVYKSPTLRDWLNGAIKDDPKNFKDNRKDAVYKSVKHFRTMQRGLDWRDYHSPASREAIVKYADDWFGDYAKEKAHLQITEKGEIRKLLREHALEIGVKPIKPKKQRGRPRGRMGKPKKPAKPKQTKHPYRGYTSKQRKRAIHKTKHIKQKIRRRKARRRR